MFSIYLLFNYARMDPVESWPLLEHSFIVLQPAAFLICIFLFLALSLAFLPTAQALPSLLQSNLAPTFSTCVASSCTLDVSDRSACDASHAKFQDVRLLGSQLRSVHVDLFASEVLLRKSIKVDVPGATMGFIFVGLTMLATIWRRCICQSVPAGDPFLGPAGNFDLFPQDMRHIDECCKLLHLYARTSVDPGWFQFDSIS